MNENCEARIEVMTAYNMGLITAEERDREFERLDNIFVVLNVDLVDPAKKFCNVMMEDLACHSIHSINKVQLN